LCRELNLTSVGRNATVEVGDTLKNTVLPDHLILLILTILRLHCRVQIIIDCFSLVTSRSRKKQESRAPSCHSFVINSSIATVEFS